MAAGRRVVSRPARGRVKPSKGRRVSPKRPPRKRVKR